MDADRSLFFQQRLDRYGLREREAIRIMDLAGALRFFFFFLFSASLIFFLFSHVTAKAWASRTAAAAFFLFVITGLVKDWQNKKREKWRLWKLANLESLAKIHRRWHELPALHNFDPAPFSYKGKRAQTWAADLNLFGETSLLQLVDSSRTWTGLKTLLEWLLNPATADEIKLRQEAAMETTAQVDFRQSFAVKAGDHQGEKRPESARKEWESFHEWLDGPSSLQGRSFLPWSARTVPLLNALFFLGGLADGRFLPLAFMVSAGGLFLSYFHRPGLDQTYSQFIHRHRELDKLNRLLLAMKEHDWKSTRLKDLCSSTILDGMGALTFLVGLASYREVSLAYVPLQALFVFDLHLLELLESWKRKYGGPWKKNFQNLGEFEAILCLGATAFEHPTMTFPELATGTRVWEARDMAHPLIADDRRVANSFLLGGDGPERGKFMFVTGPNMSGKSTFLRALGANLVLAQAGAPVMASFFRLTPASLGSCLQVEDSLERGESYYYAELLRMKELVKEAEEEHEKGRPFLFLVDEILKGTNARDRALVAVKILLKLHALQATGLATTQDLSLTQEGELKKISRVFHFSAQVTEEGQGVRMVYPYALVEGECQQMTGTLLARQLGLVDGE